MQEEEETDGMAQAAMVGSVDAAATFADAYRNAREETLEDDRKMSMLLGNRLVSSKVSPQSSPICSESGQPGKQPARRRSLVGRGSAGDITSSLPRVSELEIVDVEALSVGGNQDAVSSASAKSRRRHSSGPSDEEMDSFAVDSMMQEQGGGGGAESFAEAYREKPEETLEDDRSLSFSVPSNRVRQELGSASGSSLKGERSSQSETSLTRAMSKNIVVAAAARRGKEGSSSGSFSSMLEFSLKMFTMSMQAKSSRQVAPGTDSARVPSTGQDSDRPGGCFGCFG